MTGLAIILAVVAACLNAAGAQLQHAGVRDTGGDSGLTLRSLGALGRERHWLVGFGLLAVGAVLQIAAVSLAPLAVVAPIVVLALPLIVVLTARTADPGPARIAPATGIAAVVATLGAAVFVAVGAAVATPTVPSPSAVLSAMQFIGVLVIAMAVAGGLSHGGPRSVLFAAGAGIAYGLVAVLVRDVTQSFVEGGFAAVAPMSAIGLVVAFLGGSWLVQLGYSSGPPDVVVGVQTVLNPLVAVTIGAALMGEMRGIDGWATTGLLLASAAAIGGVAALAWERRGSAQSEPAAQPGV